MRRPSSRRYWPLRIVFAPALTCILAPLSESATIRIPYDQADVRGAVSVAAPGDTILLWPGVHSGGAFVNGKALTFASRYVVTGDTAFVTQTVLSGVAAGTCGGAVGCIGNSVLEFGDNAHGSAVIGLTLMNGENGVGSSSTVDLTRCRITANNDGVDFVVGSGGTFRNCLFDTNTDDGIDLNGRMNMTITDCEIRDNADDGIEYRLYAYSGPIRQVNITNNRITGNREDGIQFIDYPGNANLVVRVERNLLQNNYDASGLSAAIAFMPNSETIETLAGAPTNKRVYVIHNTFLGEKNGIVGGAKLIALNNIFSGIEGMALRRVGGGSIASYNLFWGNGTNYSESNVDAAHLLLANPQLNSAGRLTIASPAINAGTAFFQWQGETVLDVPPSGYADAAPDLGAFEAAPNTAPSVSAGPDRTVTLSSDLVEVGLPGALLRADAPLDGTVSDDGLPYASSASVLWTVVSGPGPVAIQSPILADTRATFSVPGTYVLQLTVNDGKLTSSDQVAVTVLGAINLPPTVSAGLTRTVTLPADAALDGTVLDDGLPIPPGALTTSWTKLSGPGTVTFQDASLVDTRAAFGTPGVYVLRLSASDGALAATDTVTIAVLPVPNLAPQVNAGPDQSVMIPALAALDGTVSDDGLPNPPALVTTTWSMVSGPAPVGFQNPSMVDTRAIFTAAGTYLLRFTATDGALSASDSIQIDVVQPPPPAEVPVAGSSDDVEERDNGNMVHNGGDLDLVYDGGNQWVGLRFAGVAVPAGATVISAHIQFEADGATTGATTLTLRGQASDNPASFSSNDYSVSSRPSTTASTAWTPPAWPTPGEAGPGQRTPDLGAIIQEILDRPGWASGNAMAIIVSGTGRRAARSYEGRAAGAARLHIEYGGLPVLASAQPGPPDQAQIPAESGPLDTREPGATARLEFALRSPSPQPSRGALRVEFTIAEPGAAKLELLDVAGRRVAVHDLGALKPGSHALDLSSRLSAGVYLVRLTQGPRAQIRKAIVLP